VTQGGDETTENQHGNRVPLWVNIATSVVDMDGPLVRRHLYGVRRGLDGTERP
jgi:hypothetical protein